MLRPALLVVAFALLLVSPAGATSFCHPRKTADGFVALRAAPSATARIIGRMKPADEVLFGLNRKGDWSEATWWRGLDRLQKGYHRTAGKGWVNVRLIEQEC